MKCSLYKKNLKLINIKKILFNFCFNLYYTLIHEKGKQSSVAAVMLDNDNLEKVQINKLLLLLKI